MPQLGRLEEADIELESSMVEHMRRVFINQTRMSKVLCPTGELQKEVAHKIQPGDWVWEWAKIQPTACIVTLLLPTCTYYLNYLE